METVEEGQNQPEIATKRIKLEAITENGGEDRISALPDCLLVEIVSRLGSTEDSIRTGTLSNRWKHIWTSIPVLIFRQLGYIQSWSDFASLVDKTLTQHRQLKLKKFVLSTRYGNRLKVESWIRYAIRCNVEELDLDLLRNSDIVSEIKELKLYLKLGGKFQLDQSFFINSCFTDLRLSGCMLHTSEQISWKNLRSLWIREVNLDKDMIENIFSGSPVLETLVLDYCNYYRGILLDITSKSLKKLVLSGFREPHPRPRVTFIPPEDVPKINAPNILSLTIKGHLFLWDLFLLNVSSLIEADLDYINFDWERTHKEKMLKRFIQDLSHVKELKLGTSCSKILSRLKAKGFVVPSNIKFPGEGGNESESESESEIIEIESESESESGSGSGSE